MELLAHGTEDFVLCEAGIDLGDILHNGSADALAWPLETEAPQSDASSSVDASDTGAAVSKADAKKPSVVMRCTFRPFIPRLPSAGERPDGLLTVVFGALTSWPGAGVRVRAACGAAVVLEELLPLPGAILRGLY